MVHIFNYFFSIVIPDFINNIKMDGRKYETNRYWNQNFYLNKQVYSSIQHNQIDDKRSEKFDAFKSTNNLISSQILKQEAARRSSLSPADVSLMNRYRSPKRGLVKIAGISSDQQALEGEIESQKQTIKFSNDKLSRYETIAELTQQQNQNLKQQNKYLLQKLRKMQQREQKMKDLYLKAQKYKKNWIQVKDEIDLAKQEMSIYRSLCEDFQRINMVDIPKFINKVEITNNQINQQEGDQRNSQDVETSSQTKVKTDLGLPRDRNKKKGLREVVEQQRRKSFLRERIFDQSIEQCAEQQQQKTIVSQKSEKEEKIMDIDPKKGRK